MSKPYTNTKTSFTPPRPMPPAEPAIPATPPKPTLATRLVTMAGLKNGNVVLVPACGEGAIVRAVLESGVDFASLTAVELNPVAVATTRDLVEACDADVNLIEGDFLKLRLRREDFDRIVMGLPASLESEKGQDIVHVTHALTLLAPGGILVAVMSPNTRRKGFEEMLIGYHDFEITETQPTFPATIILTVRK